MFLVEHGSYIESRFSLEEEHIQDWKKKVSYSFSKQYGIAPLCKEGNSWIIISVTPVDFKILDYLYFLIREKVVVKTCSKESLLKVIDYIYFTSDKTQFQLTQPFKIETSVMNLLESSNDSPTIDLLNHLLKEAVKRKASDIHIEVFSGKSSVRMRCDGVLKEIMLLNMDQHISLCSRVKIMSDLDVAQKRLPQDGSFKIHIGELPVDIRVSFIPTVHCERLVLRILDNKNLVHNTAALNMPLEIYNSFSRCANLTQSMILVTGPTGSGKTTTLYATLLEKIPKGINIMSIEDPVEYILDGISQINVNYKLDFDFCMGLKHILRQDPDVIMIGEIRDQQTAEIAIRASLTGHLVLSTFHASDAITALTRLLEMGISPYLVASSLSGILSQRLIRKYCPYCLGKKCDRCYQSGFQGRIPIFEFLEIDDELKEGILQKKHLSALKELMIQKRFKTLQYYAQEYVKQQITSQEEVLRVLSL